CLSSFMFGKQAVQRRIDLLEAGGAVFTCNTTVGVEVTADQLRAQYDAVLLAVGAQRARPLDVPGRDLAGVVPAMDYLTATTQTHLGTTPKTAFDVKDADVIVIGGGDTGADCVGTALRQGCRSLLNITRREKPGLTRDAAHPWPGPPDTYTLDYAHAEGAGRFGRDPREFRVQPVAFVADPADPVRLAGVRVRRLDSGEEQTLPARFVFLSIGFVGHDSPPLVDAFGLEESRGRLRNDHHRTAQPGVYVAGDCRRGASLVVWAIREGRDAASAIHDDLTSPRAVLAAVPTAAIT
ncbi:MAG: FAD-dependent oxidoreductase, partial [Planctomycetota bacterium]